jgi:transposase
MKYIAFDCHKRYTQASIEDADGRICCEKRINHDRGAIEAFLSRWDRGSPVAVETVGNWYWIVDEVESAGMKPQLVNALKAKLMLGSINKTDKLDCHGLNRLQRTGTLPKVWIPPGELRDLRELTRTRMVHSRTRTRLKNRIHATLSKYGLRIEEVTDVFAKKGRVLLEEKLRYLPEHTRFCARGLLQQLDRVGEQIEAIERRMKEVFTTSKELELLMTLPGVGFILATVMLLEIGEMGRFADPSRFASYAGTTPRVHASGGKVRYGKTRPDVNHYLKWAYHEAATVISRFQRRYAQRHVNRLYARIRHRRGHGKAAGAVARHLAEASYWMLMKGEPYREPQKSTVSSTEG